MASTIPIYFETGLDPVFGLLSLPAVGARLRTAVVICPPWGWDDVSSYRSRRRWATTLAEAGHPTLRFGLPGADNSGGGPSDPARVDAWVAAVSTAAAKLRETYEPNQVAAVGVGLGGLLAQEAIARGAEIDEIVLWGSPPSGRAFSRQALAFSNMQEWSAEEAELPEGWIEAGGFLLSAETIAALRGISPWPPPESPLRRALLLERDGTAVEAKVRDGLTAAGVEVSTGAGRGWGLMVSHPERSSLPLEVVGAVETWLRRGEEEEASGGDRLAGEPKAPAWARGELDLLVEGRPIKESPLLVEQGFGQSFGVLTVPSKGAGTDLCAVFLNAGAVRHVGPNRMWVETGRRWAAAGIPSLRVDLEAIGEADGDESRLLEVSEFYTERYEHQVGRVLDALQSRGVGNRFLLVGLCAGAYWSFRAALSDDRVEAAVLLNAGALRWHPEILGEREARKISQIRHWRRWKKLLRGDIGRERLGSFLRSLLRRLSRRAGGRRDFDADLDRLRERGTRLSMAFSGSESLAAELESEAIPSRLERWPNVTIQALPGEDHTLRPLSAQLAARDLLDRELERVRARGGASYH
jgi:dienelactone hydrolase